METPIEIKDSHQIEKCSGAFSFYGFAWKKLWKYFLELLLVTIVSLIVTIPTWGFWDEETKIPFQSSVSIDLFFFSFEGIAAYLFLGLMFVLLFQWPLEYGISYVNLQAVRDNKFHVKDMFEVFKNYWNSVFANLLVVIIIGFGMMMIIVPGIIFACKLAFVPYLVVDKKMEAVEAVKTSWQMTNGYSLTIFFIGFLIIFVFLLGVLAFGVGALIAIMWIRLSFASVYFSASNKLELQETYALSKDSN